MPPDARCIIVVSRQGTQRDAVLFSVGANGSHGLRRTNADKRRAVETLLRDAEWSQWSNREVARKCSVDESLVRNMRPPVSAVKPQTEEPAPRKVERNGTRGHSRARGAAGPPEGAPVQAVRRRPGRYPP